ncbi:MAG TPA: ABC transporter substrate-binding protein [Thermoleophilaceae bacterium]|jgi:ABC-type nitrate/sulfonate/bicarbonate transport system substrate-binding protein|nr:ABC transporter substrate-binding protein [Thermoleophilaceae bacterium]
MGRISFALLVALCSALLAACGGSDSGSSASGSSNGSTSGIRVAYASELDPNDVADQFGLQAAGAKVQTLNDDSAVIAGLQRGSIDVGNVDFNQAVSARSKGLPIKIIYVAQTTPEYVLVGRPEVASLNDLAGKKVGFQEPGSQTELFAKNIVKEKAAGIYGQVDFLALAESSRRAQALVAKRLDASPIESINLAQLEKQGGYHELATWADLTGDASKAIGTAWITTDKILAKDKARITAFVKDLQKGYNKTYADKQAWVALAEKTLPDVDASLLPAVYDIYTRRNMYPKSGQPALTPETWAANEKFYRSIGEWEKPQGSAVVDFDTINAGAQESGKTA